MKGGVERSTRGAATAAQTLTDVQNGVVERTVQKDLEALHHKKVNGATRNAVLFGPTDSNNQPSALSAGLNPLDLKVNGAITPITISFAKGFDKDTGPIDTVVSITTDEVINLPALDDNTVPISYSADLCNGGTVISGGDNASYPKANAFDGNDSTWFSSQTGTGVNGVAWIGYNFGVPRSIRRTYVNQLLSNSVISIKIQYSDDGSTWDTAGTYTTGEATASLDNNDYYQNIPYVGAHQYWRILANANPSSGSWGVQIIEMYEALETLYVYAEKVGDHGYQLGYTKQKPRYDVVSDTYTDNLCKGGAVISGGDGVTSGVNILCPKETAFDGKISGCSVDGTFWRSLQTGSGISGVAYIGYDFGVPRQIRKIILTQTIGHGYVTSAKIQKSVDKTNWVDVFTVNGLTAGGNEIFYLDSSPAQYWRILANSNRDDSLSTGTWCVDEVTMHELATDLHFYDQVAETMNHYNGTAWEQKERVFIGEAYTTTDALYGYKTYDYDAARLNVAPATLPGMPVNLGQFVNLLQPNGWAKIAGGLIIQVGVVTGGTETSGSVTTTFPIPFPTACLIAIPIDNVNTSNIALIGWDDTATTTTSVKFWWSTSSLGRFTYLAIGY